MKNEEGIEKQKDFSEKLNELNDFLRNPDSLSKNKKKDRTNVLRKHYTGSFIKCVIENIARMHNSIKLPVWCLA